MRGHKIFSFIVLLVFLNNVNARVKLPRLVSDGMVLQRDTKINIWGWATRGDTVTIWLSTFGKKIVLAVANDKGEWSVTIPPQKPGGPYSMKIKSGNEIIIKDILIGDVWICGGQSNMELSMDRVKYKYPEEISKANNEYIRQFLVPDKYDFNHPQPDVDSGEWLPATKKNIGQFSAVAYFFAKEIYAKYKVPVGLINSALGGSPAEAWISEDALKKFPAYYKEAQRFKNKDLITEIETKDKTISNSWYSELNQKDEGLKNNWKMPETSDHSWKEMKIPGYWADTETGAINGVVWFTKEIIVPQRMVGKQVKLELGRIVDADSVFINGQYAGHTTYQYPPRRYELSSNLIRPGKNTIVIRVVNSSGRGGFVSDKRYELSTVTDTIDLKGNWKYKVGAVMPALPGQTFIRWKPLGLYNAMIAPLINYAIKGVIWYQGESNTGKPEEYDDLMQALIADWRSKWRNDDLPFLFVQLANFMEAKKSPQESNWAALRQQQLQTNFVVPKTGMAVTIDIGEWNDVHPENKKDVGHRLALQARSIAYRENEIMPNGPQYWSAKTEGNKIIIEFTDTGEGLIIKGKGELKHFAIAGKDGEYMWANAKIRYNTVIVWNDAIPEPVAVRYAWADNPEGANLINKEGLPASPFTTEWPK